MYTIYNKIKARHMSQIRREIGVLVHFHDGLIEPFKIKYEDRTYWIKSTRRPRKLDNNDLEWVVFLKDGRMAKIYYTDLSKRWYLTKPPTRIS